MERNAERSLKQEIAIALLHDLSWVPKPGAFAIMAEYLSEDPPNNFAEEVDLSARYLAAVVDVYADHIRSAVT